MSKISLSGYLIYAGCFAATLSSAIASLVGAPRVLQVCKKTLSSFSSKLHTKYDFYKRPLLRTSCILSLGFLKLVMVQTMTLFEDTFWSSSLLLDVFL